MPIPNKKRMSILVRLLCDLYITVNWQDTVIEFRFALAEKLPRKSSVVPGAVANRQVIPDHSLENSCWVKGKKSLQLASGDLCLGHSRF